MESNMRILFFVVVLFVLYKTFYKKDIKEHVSMGTLTQLMAKGPQDTYLSKDAEKWVNMQYPYPHGYTNFVWNNPTRLYRPYYPYYPYFQYSSLFPYAYYPRNFVKLG